MTANRARTMRAVPVAWQSLIDGYVTWMRAVGRSPRTVDGRRCQLMFAARELGGDPIRVTHDDLIAWFARYPDWKAETRRSHRAALIGFFAWAYKFGHVMANPASDLPRMRIGEALPNPVPDLAWREALQRADPRVSLMLRLAAEAGLRRAEVASVHTRDLIDGVGGAQLVVHGKGGKQRMVPLSPSLAALIAAGARGHSPAQPADGWLFPAERRGSGHLHPAHVGRLVSAVLPADYTMHKLRHRFATRAYRGTRNLRAVQTLLGHASVKTTEIYTAVDADEIRAAAMAAALEGI